MDIVLKATAFAVIGAVCVVLIKQLRPEISVFVQLAGLFAVLIISAQAMRGAIDFVNGFAKEGIVQGEYIALLLKALAISVIAKIGSDLCRDSGNNALAFGVELVGRVLILAMCLPMLKSLAQITSGLLGKGI